MKFSNFRKLVGGVLFLAMFLLTVTAQGGRIPSPISNPQIIICQPCVCILCILPGFSLATSTSSFSLPFNHLSDTATISDSSFLNYNGTIVLTAAVLPSVTNGPTVSFSPGSICVGVGFYCFLASTSSVMTVSASSSTPNGDYSVTVTGTSGSIVHSLIVSVNVPSPFVLDPSPPSINHISGQTQDVTITVHSLFGYSGDVALTSATTPSGPSVSFSSSTVSITGSSSPTSTLTFGSTTLGNYSITITGTSGSFTNTAVIAANTTDYKLSNNPGPTNVQAGSPYTSKVDIGSFNGFTGTVHMSATVKPSGPKVTFSSDSLNIAANGKVSTMVTILASDPGTYAVNVTGTSGSASRSTIYTVTIAPLPPTIFGLAPMNFYGIVGGLATAGVVAGAVVVTRRRKSSSMSPPPAPSTAAPSSPGGSTPEAGSPPAAPEGKKGMSKLIPGAPGVQLPKPLVEHKVPILLVAVGTALVVAALATISPAAGLFGGLFIPGILLLGLGSVVLFLQLYQRPVAVRRFCMHCGFQMPMTGAGACPRCGKQPMSGIDTRVCPNCNGVIPTLAKFCKECGAGQPNVPAA